MILPDKHIKLSESLIGLGSYVLDKLNKPKTIDQLWQSVRLSHKTGEYPASHSFENLVLTLDTLYTLNIIDGNDEGKLFICVS